MVRYAPIAVGVLLIVAMTYIQVQMTDRFSGVNITAEQRSELLKNVPERIGDWLGTDLPIDEAVKKTAGAVGAVSRRYRNIRTNEEVDLWLIVGHGRAISAHTPDICYPASGFSSRSNKNATHTMVMDDGTRVPFLTNTFHREDGTGRRLVRVFWTWYNTEDKKHDNQVVWEAPSNARWHFGNTRALYKMYLTSQMRDQMETTEASPCEQFAHEFIPVANKALTAVYDSDGGIKSAAANTEAASGETPEAADASTDDAKADVEPADATESAAEESPVKDEIFDADASAK